MKKIILLASLFAVTATWGQKTIRDDNAQNRPARNFHAIEVSDGIDLYLSQGSTESVAVSASSLEHRDRIKVEVVNGVLKIFYDRGGINWGWSINRKMRAYVSIKTIDKLNASGGSDVEIDNELNASSLAIRLSGGSDFKGRVIAEGVSLSASGGSDADISGKADRIEIDASGGSDVNGFGMITDYCTVESSGGSDVTITANKSLTGRASGGSDIHYKGTASSTTSNKSGGSSIKKVG
jgi:ribosomal protein S6E (S10)